MGRHETGAITTKEALRIELSYLLRKGYFKNGATVNAILSWTDGSDICVETYLKDGFGYIRLKYTVTTSRGEKTDHNYKIQITSVPSNLGNGSVLYFVCPVSSKRCRILYKCYGSKIWKHRKAYLKRIYYNTQICSKLYYHTERYFNIEKQLDDLKKPVKSHYRGKVTSTSIKYQRLTGLLIKHDMMRWQIFDEYFKAK